MARINYIIGRLVFIFLTVFGLSALSQTRSPCPALKKEVNVSVITSPRDITYQLGVKQNKLNQLAGKILRTRANNSSRVLGLTSTGHSITYEMSSQTARIGPNRYCSRIRSVNMNILVTKINVYVLGEYRRGSCQYNAVIDHEHEHVATFQSGIKTLEREFNSKLPHTIRNLPAGIGSTPKQAGQSAFLNLKHSINKLRKPIERMMKLRNRQIDTPKSYKLLTQQCINW